MFPATDFTDYFSNKGFKTPSKNLFPMSNELFKIKKVPVILIILKKVLSTKILR